LNRSSQKEVDMISKNTIRLVLCLAAFLAAVGCGDASPDGAIGSKCQQMCQHGDKCPNLYAPSDCVSTCEAAVADAELLGGTCPGALEVAIGCQLNLSCDELMRRAISSSYTDQCVAREQAVLQCIPGDPEPAGEELSLACEAVCHAVDDCPRTEATANCVQVCVADYGRAEDGAADCSGAIVNTLTCQAAMTCAEIENRVLGRPSDDSCRNADRSMQSTCTRP